MIGRASCCAVAATLISHDLSTVGRSDDVIVMLNGEVVERLPADRLPDGATHPYSRRLFASVPKLDPWTVSTPLPGRAAGPGSTPAVPR